MLVITKGYGFWRVFGEKDKDIQGPFFIVPESADVPQGTDISVTILPYWAMVIHPLTERFTGPL
jgi:hypothetical protein